MTSRYGDEVYNIAKQNKKQNGDKGNYGVICLETLRTQGINITPKPKLKTETKSKLKANPKPKPDPKQLKDIPNNIEIRSTNNDRDLSVIPINPNQPTTRSSEGKFSNYTFKKLVKKIFN